MCRHDASSLACAMTSRRNRSRLTSMSTQRPCGSQRQQVKRTAFQTKLSRDDRKPAFEQRGVTFDPVFELLLAVERRG